MPRYVQLHDTIWADDKFYNLSPNGQRMFIYFLSCQHGNMIGYYRVPLAYIEYDLRLSEKEVLGALTELEQANMVLYDAPSSMVMIPTYLKHNPIRGENQAKGVLNTLKELPRDTFHAQFVCATKKYMPEYVSLFKEYLERYEYAIDRRLSNISTSPLEAPSDTLRSPLEAPSNSETETETETVSETETNTCASDDASVCTFEETKPIEKPRSPFKSFKQQERFDRFWAVYPKKKSKGQAEKAWIKINPDDELLGVMLSSLERWKRSREWLREGGQYIPHPSTWLNAKGWEDELPVSRDSPTAQKNYDTEEDTIAKLKRMGVKLEPCK